ncbi:3-isopropylmalate dehydratase large subunit [Virgibacillus necropolis]|uniref:3-isopropylmalate dehydratase large subunit n=1 Tax=Virgibacillus necropolis TaxID=163877 RepID=A0A221MA58_9BACI|nr:3-isopropylmalate dehydratase large subunit [Virgibacillus necropolis]ASN04502.1 3-isopropylmalate dehydratase large subunit [Virgibacillus necropolis]
MAPRTLFEKVWENHVIDSPLDLPLIFIDLHLIHDVTSPQAFSLLRDQGRTVRRPDLTFASADHNVPTTDRNLEFKDLLAKKQVEALISNCKEFDITAYDLDHPDNGIVHIIGPELGLTTPGKTIVCGDSHTSTHGAFGAFAFGIGSSEITHVLATQTLPQVKPKTMNIQIEGDMPEGVSSKDIILSIIGEIGTDGGVGHVVEFTGNAVKNMSMDERMTICNMVLEAGARSGMVAPDEKTIAYLKNRQFVPKGQKWDEAVREWSKLYSDPNAVYDKTITINIGELAPQVTWGTNPGQVTSIDDYIPSPGSFTDSETKATAEAALYYMDLKPLTKMNEIDIDRVFIGSCTNSRIEDLRLAAQVAHGHKVNKSITSLVVPGSYHIKRRAEKEGLDKVFIEAGFEWREPGCSMCPGMNPDIANPGDRVASTSNRNFEGRQGKGVRTHLVSPAMAAAAAITGRLTDIRGWNYIGEVKKNETIS